MRHRAYQAPHDFWRVRQLLIETYPLTPVEWNWEIRRWEGWHTHRENPAEVAARHPEIHLWETDAGQLVGVVHPEGRGEVWLEIHPDYRDPLEENMLLWAEAHLPALNDDNRPQLDWFIFEYDTPRLHLAEKHGYQKTPWWGMSRRMRFGNKPLPAVNLAEGYTLRAITTEDSQRVADILNAGFGRTSHTAREFDRFAHESPSFRYDLHLVAETPEGLFASFVGVTYDEANHRGIFEPVCTHPDHVRRGLARALMVEGLHRLKALGAWDAYVGTGDMTAANQLYETMGFTEAYRSYLWRKVF